jgi:uncharacterized cysteine cluster protein YcgN (CxxCxxCC family)
MAPRVSSQVAPFWRDKSLNDLTQKEWESLCDGCGRCCLNKIEYVNTQEIVYTNASCKLLDNHSCRCKDYPNRTEIVRDCIVLTPKSLSRLDYMPETCAYRRISEGKDLEPWHPLVSGDPNTVHTAGISVRGRAVSEESIVSLEDHVIKWIKPIRRGRKKKKK